MPYQLELHRHVKIWLSRDHDIFMNDENQLRLVQMRASCPGDEINLVYDSRLLSPEALVKMKAFCIKHSINGIDVVEVTDQCTTEEEAKLLKIYEDEIFNLDAGGNLAAASDILRWLKPVYRSGIYTDVDCHAATKDLPETIEVSQDMIFNAGSWSETSHGTIHEQHFATNDIMTILDLDSPKIKIAQRQILSRCDRKNIAEFITETIPSTVSI